MPPYFGLHLSEKEPGPSPSPSRPPQAPLSKARLEAQTQTLSTGAQGLEKAFLPKA